MYKIYIKGMVCQRCISTVKELFESIGLRPASISLGELTIADNTGIPDTLILEAMLKQAGFSLLVEKRNKLVNDVKQLVNTVYNGEFDFPVGFRFSSYVSGKLNKDYETIGPVFSYVEHTTLEQYIINYRIEKVKEFLVYTSQTLADISFRLGFSSVPHLSRQFRNITGFNPSHYKSIRANKHHISNGFT